MHRRLTLYSSPGRMGKGPEASLLPPSVLPGPGRPHAGAGVAHGAAVHLVPVRGGRAPQAPAGPRGRAHGQDAHAHSPRRKVNAGSIGAWCVGGALWACMTWQVHAGCLFMSAHSTLARLPPYPMLFTLPHPSKPTPPPLSATAAAPHRQQQAHHHPACVAKARVGAASWRAARPAVGSVQMVGREWEASTLVGGRGWVLWRAVDGWV